MTMTQTEPVDMKLEVVVLGVSDVDRAKAFYEKLGWRLDADFVKGDDFRVIQFTPHNSEASIIFCKGVPSPKPVSAQSLTSAVIDIATFAELLHETEQHHGDYEKTHGKHNWWDWYAPYLSARQNGKSPEEAAAAADRYMEKK